MATKKDRFDVRGDQIIVNLDVMLEIMECTKAYTTTLKKEGLLVQPKLGTYDLIPSLRNYIKKLKNKSTFETDSGTLDFHVEKARLTKMQADKAEMEVMELSGALVRVEDVVDEWQSQLMDMKGKLLSIPSKLATIVTDIDNPAEVQDLIDDYIREALQELAAYAGDGKHTREPIESKDGAKATTKANDKPVGRPRKKAGRSE